MTCKNYYDLLGVHIGSTEREILKAYRRKALSCHPDKNPDNPKAGELFIEISEALKILTDKNARAAFDKVLKAKEAAKLRTQAFDVKRKKFKEDLEQRENDAQQERENDISATEKLAAEIKRLREEGSRLLKEQQELIEKQLAEERKNNIDLTPKLKANVLNVQLLDERNIAYALKRAFENRVKWKASKIDHQNGGYNDEILKDLFSKYGHVTAIVLSKKNGMAIVEYERSSYANMAFEFEKGLEENPLIISWLDNPAISNAETEKVAATDLNKPPPKSSQQSSNITDTDFESIVLMKMRQAEERKRLAAQIIDQDKKEETDNSLSAT